jgi:4-amino-4-deoxy-L-arabinose transferase-like glycosyltransferase
MTERALPHGKPDSAPSESRRWVDPLIALALGTGYVALLLATVRHLGYARDEGFYFDASRSYQAWFEFLFKHPAEALTQVNVDRYWAANHEHPAMMKSLFAFSNRVFYHDLHWFHRAGTSFRFPGMVVSALAVSVTYLWGTQAINRLAGLVGAVSLAMMPRVFFQSHLACFDMPVASMWLVASYAYWRSVVRGGIAWPVAAGILYGLLLDTKHNSWLLPGALIAHVLITRGARLRRDLKRGRIPVPAALFTMAAIGPVVLYNGWPWIWHATGRRLADYMDFHLAHVYYNMEFLGYTYWKPPMPRLYAWVMTAATVPGITLLLFAIGLAASFWCAYGAAIRRRFRAAGNESAPRRDEQRFSTDVLWFLCLFLAYAPWLSHHTPIFGGTKHWMTAYPFLCLFAARGFQLVRERLAELPLFGGCAARALTAPAFAACVLVGPTVMTLHSGTWGLSTYTPLVGGAEGAATLGLNRTFWGYTTGELAGYLNQHVPRHGFVFVHDTAIPSWDMLREDRMLRPDLRGTLAIEESDFALYHHEPHMERVEYQVWVDYGTDAPVDIGTYDGVPVIWLFKRPGTPSR